MEKPKMSEAELAKDLEAVGAVSDALAHALEAKRKKFEDTPEGREVDYLKKCDEFYFQSLEAFLKRFIYMEGGTEPGMRKVVKDIEHPSTGFRPDKELLKRLNNFAHRVEKSGAAADTQIFLKYKYARDQIEKMQVSPDIDRFAADFWRLLEGMKKQLPGTPIAKLADEGHTATYAMETYTHSMLVLKFMLSRLYRPEQKSRAMAVIKEVPDRGKVTEYMSISLAMDPGAVNSEIDACFATKGEEDANFSNLLSFSGDLAKKGQKSIFIRYLHKTGQAKIADAILNTCVRHGASVQDPKVISLLAGAVDHLSENSVKSQYENAAKDEVKRVLDDAMKSMEKTWNSELRDVKTLFKDRIDALMKEHLKELKDIENETRVMGTSAKDVIGGLDYASLLADTYGKRSISVKDGMTQGAEALAAIQAAVHFLTFARGEMQEPDFLAAMDRIEQANGSDFVRKTVTKFKEYAHATIAGSVPIDKLADYAKSLREQFIPQLTARALRHYDDILSGYDKMERDVSEMASARIALEQEASRTEKLRRRYSKRLEGLRAELSSEDEERLRQYGN